MFTPHSTPLSLRLGLIAAALSLLMTLACGPSKSESTPVRPADPESPQAASDAPTQQANGVRLVVVLVIDQLASWTFDRDLHLFDGGIARLLSEGVFYPRSEIPFASTFTAPGHAALGTGTPPAQSRILANAWYHPVLGTKVSAVWDPDSPIVAIGEQPAPKLGAMPFGVSGKRLGVDGLAETLRAASRDRARSVSISIKRRAAILATGKKPTIAIWYDSTQAAMTTSTYYGADAPAWLRQLAVDKPVRARLDYTWNRLPDIDHAAVTGVPDENPGEAEEYGLGAAFPYQLAKSSAPAKSLRSTPLGDDLLLETARAALVGESLGTDDAADLLTVSFSSHDYAGHNWGQESWERLDMLLRLDDKIGDFLTHLDRTVGRGKYAVVLTSDHGASPLIEHSRKAGKAAHRIRFSAVRAVAEAAAGEVLGQGPGSWLADVSSCNVYPSHYFGSQPEAKRNQALDAMVAAIAAIPGMEYATRVDRIAGQCEQRTGLDALACRSVIPEISGVIFFTADQYSLLTRYGTGTGHGSANLFDRHVPLIISAPGWQPARVEDSPVSMLQIAPTVAHLLGVPSPADARQKALQPPASRPAASNP